jgi:hypothetical protein
MVTDKKLDNHEYKMYTKNEYFKDKIIKWMVSVYFLSSSGMLKGPDYLYYTSVNIHWLHGFPALRTAEKNMQTNTPWMREKTGEILYKKNNIYKLILLFEMKPLQSDHPRQVTTSFW